MDRVQPLLVIHFSRSTWRFVGRDGIYIREPSPNRADGRRPIRFDITPYVTDNDPGWSLQKYIDCI